MGFGGIGRWPASQGPGNWPHAALVLCRCRRWPRLLAGQQSAVKKGRRLPMLKEALTESTIPCKTVEKAKWYGERERHLQVTSK
jgi:hypothetical protein